MGYSETQNIQYHRNIEKGCLMKLEVGTWQDDDARENNTNSNDIQSYLYIFSVFLLKYS